ncbi:MAG: acylphosphatase [Pseudomonadales bacterium]
MQYTVKGNVRGRVQGVGFRAYVKGKAQENEILGWAKNLPDGSVEVVLKGERKSVNLVQHLVSTGPRGSDVRALNWALIDEIDVEGFSVL